MTEQEARQLKTGDKVTFADEVEGEVINTNQHCIEIQWADGVHGYISPLDCEKVARADAQSERR